LEKIFRPPAFGAAAAILNAERMTAYDRPVLGD